MIYAKNYENVVEIPDSDSRVLVIPVKIPCVIDMIGNSCGPHGRRIVKTQNCACYSMHTGKVLEKLHRQKHRIDEGA